MKKFILILIAVAITGLTANHALAGRLHHGPMDGTGNGSMQTMTDEQIQARQTFMTETADIRQALAVKRGEYRALMAGDNPSPEKAGLLAGNIAELKNQLREKAAAAGISFRGHGMGHGAKGKMGGMGNCNW